MKPYLFALGAFLAAWQGMNFDLEPRAVLGALTAALLSALNPTKTNTPEVDSAA